MAEDLIDSYVDRAGVKQDTDFMVSAIKEVYAEFKKLESVKIDLKGATGLAGSLPAMQQAKAGMDSLAAATETVRQRIAQMNGNSKEFTQVLLTQTKAQKEAANAALLEAKAANETAKAKLAEAKAADQAAKAKQIDNKVAEQAGNDYFQLSKAYNEAALKAKNYYITLGEAHPITVQTIKDASDIGNVLKKADAAVGQFQRNVGNYKSAFDGLGFSFSQVGRELPSLAINLQTFALAISNNLPMVADELAKASSEIKRLKAEGKETPSLFQRIGKALFSFQTLLSVGITLLTLYAGKLFNVGDNAKAVKEATDKLNDSFDRQDASVRKVIDTLKDYEEIDLLNLQINGATAEKQNKVRIQYAERYLDNLRELETEAIKKSTEATQKADALRALSKDNLVRSLIQKEKEISEAEAAESKKRAENLRAEIEKGERDIIKMKTQFRKEDAEKTTQANEDAADKASEIAERNAQASFTIEELRLQRVIDFNQQIADDEENRLAKRLAALQFAREAEIELAIRTADLEKNSGEKTAKELEAIEAKKYDAILRINKAFNEKARELRDDDIQSSLDAAAEFEKKFNKALQDRFERDMERIKKLKDANQKAGEDQLKADQKFADDKKKLFEDLAEELQNLTFTLFTAGVEQQKNAIQEQIDLLEQKKQKDIEVANQTFTNAQDRAAAIAVIEARAQAQRENLQRKQRDLDVKKAQFDKAQAVARIIQETALNVIKYFGTPLAILAGAIGAVQLAAVIAQPIPRYKHGKNVSDDYEGPAIVGDGGKPEAIIRESGQVEITGSKPELTYVKKRDIVLPDARMLSDLVVSGQMSGKLMERQVIVENTGMMEIKGELQNVVMAIKKIPQPVIHTTNIISMRVRHGDSSNQYLNKNLQQS